MNKLLEIKEIIGFKQENPHGFIDATDGYEVITNETTYRILIDNFQCCCEDWGYFSSDDDFERYYGKTLIAVVLTDTVLNQKKLEEILPYGIECGGIQFVDFKFSDGSVLQFAVYNSHNGYYGHDIYVVKDQKIVTSNTL